MISRYLYWPFFLIQLRKKTTTHRKYGESASSKKAVERGPYAITVRLRALTILQDGIEKNDQSAMIGYE